MMRVHHEDVRRGGALALALAVVVGCGKSAAERPQEGAGSAAAGAAAPTAADARPPPADGAEVAEPEPSAPVDHVAVEVLLQSWRDAQNEGAFETYQSFYAQEMEGVKRVGARTWRFNRDGWLADRGRMFKKPMTVAISDVKISGSARTPVVELVQSFRQGSFADEGPKRIVLNDTAGGLRIVREEMLASKVAPAQVAAFLTMPIDGTPYVVIEDRADPSVARGALRGPFSAGDGAHYTLRDASRAPEAAEWVGKKLSVFAASGERCPATVVALRVVSGGTPYMDQPMIWKGMDGEPPATRAQMARDVYAIGGHKLVGELAVEGACAPLLAMEQSAAPVVFSPVADAGQLPTRAVAAFRKLPEYATLQADYVGTYSGKGAWVKAPKTLVVGAGDRRVVVVSALTSNSCGDFYGALTAAFEDRNGKLGRLDLGREYFEPNLVIDIDGDGALEAVGVPADLGALRAMYSSGSLAPVLSLEFPFNDCGC